MRHYLVATVRFYGTQVINRWRKSAASVFASRPRPLRVYLILFALGLALPLLLLSAFFLSQMASLERDQIERRVSQVAEALTWDIDRELDRAIVTLETLATSEALANADFGTFHAQATRALRRTNTQILLLDLSLQQLLNTRVPFGTALPTTALAEVALRVIGTKEPQISDLFIGAVAKEPVIAVEIPVFIRQELRYILVMSIDPPQLVDVLKGQRLDRQWITAITDRKGIIVARSDRHAEFVGKPVPENLLASSLVERGVFRAVSVAGEPIVGATLRSARAGWLVSATVPASYVDASHLLGWRLFYVLIVTALAGGGSLAYIFARFIAQPLTAATVVAKRLGEGHHVNAEDSPLIEANTLTKALTDASQALSQRSEALSDALARFDIALRGADITVFTQDLHRRYLWVSKGAWDRVVGLREEDILPSEAQRPAVEFKEKVLRTGVVQEADLSATIDGEHRTWRVRAEPTYDPMGAIDGVIGVAVDVTKVRRAEGAMAQLAAIVASTGEAILGKSLEGIIETWNPAAEHMFGFTTDEVIGRSAAILIPDHRASEIEDIHAQVRTGQTVSLETVRRTKDGREIHVAINVAPTRDEAGNITGICSVMHDISDRKRREDHTSFLMRELAHRSKNLLAVVKGMATQTVRQSQTVEEFQLHFDRRIHGLANSQDLLVRQNWKGAYLDELIRAQLEVFVDADGSRIRSKGPRVFLESEAVQNIGLALHELATNASKYGALSNAAGFISISWRLDPKMAKDRRLHLVWQEHDGPPVIAPTRGGFGRMVIELMVGQALRGSVQLEFPSTGVVWHLQIPARYAQTMPSEESEDVQAVGSEV
jgi:PAS domain S-box-containing protein